MIYADSNIIIRLIEGDAAARAPLESRLLPHRETSRFLGTSRLSLLECRCQPLRQNDVALLELYGAFFTGEEVVVLEITADVITKATEIRAGLNLKTPDAIHLATAIEFGATAFLTGDRQLIRCTEIAVEVI